METIFRPAQRLVKRIASGVLASMLLTGMARPAESQSAAVQAADNTTAQLPKIAVLSEDQQSKLGDALGDSYGTSTQIDWYTDPEALKNDPQRQEFVIEVQKRCARMGLEQAPHILIMGPDVDKDGNIPTSNVEDAAGGIVPGVGSIIIFRNGIFGSNNSLLTDREALGVTDHELWHIRKSLERGSPLQYPVIPDEKLPAAQKEKAYKIQFKIAKASRFEESQGDLNAVRLNDGPALLSALDKITALDRKEFAKDPTAFGYSKETTYDQVLNGLALMADHPLDPTRRLTLQAEIDQHEKKENPNPPRRSLKPF